jgi:chaperonin cofactor prefoldin
MSIDGGSLMSQIKTILEELYEEREYVSLKIEKLKAQLYEFEERLADLQIEIDEGKTEPQEGTM